ncbi:MAG: fluoride efflux transporter CrcB [Bacteroidetes bacterium]|jgi:CrcB protein|nr:MAG: fluoride efflux transporter CrcB [Bacteroidota bacterium]
MIKNFLIVGLGGAAGSILRYAVQRFFQVQNTSAFPTGTLLVNIAGCFLIGILWSIVSRSLTWNEEMKLLLMTGFCGGFTTFSAFTLEGIGLLKENKAALFLIYFTASVVGGLVATFIGIRIAK